MVTEFRRYVKVFDDYDGQTDRRPTLYVSMYT